MFPDIGCGSRLSLRDDAIEKLMYVPTAHVNEVTLAPFGIDVELERTLDLAPAFDVGFGVLVDEALGDRLECVRLTRASVPENDFCRTSIAVSRASLTPRIG